jgi:hypothetical protein
MKGYEQTSREVSEIGSIDFSQDSVFIHDNWHQNLRRSNGKPYFEASVVLGYLAQLSQELNGAEFRCSYKDVAQSFSLTKDQVRNAIKYLESSCLISTTLKTVNRESNVLFIRVNQNKISEIAKAPNLVARQVSNPYGRPSSLEWEQLKSQTFKRDSYSCVYCSRSDKKLHCDHIVPISRGGTNDLSNLATACERCNTSKGARTLKEWRAK